MGSNQVLLLVAESHSQTSQTTRQMDRLVALVLATTVACASPVEPLAAVPEVYRQWFAEVEQCSGLRGDFDAIHWQYTQDVTVDGKAYYGYWWPSNRIVIRSDMIEYKQLVMHEEMHMLLHNGQHPAEYFDQKCGDLIDL